MAEQGGMADMAEQVGVMTANLATGRGREAGCHARFARPAAPRPRRSTPASDAGERVRHGHASGTDMMASANAQLVPYSCKAAGNSASSR